ncbi:hypothetical protein WN51_07738 [Melipona quadrifasciata]|uniref:Uncharacterized protein n=1 Tax=Melipona quadrifasciata TaxID=166423 RepID=A0A0N0U6M4_9HYME|nr:hypothetical protein WN51_07738 [Melipona quadrifasciata]
MTLCLWFHISFNNSFLLAFYNIAQFEDINPRTCFAIVFHRYVTKRVVNE